jgi:phosphate uptake regulator
MENRKVQLTGGSTLVISLPKKWVNETKIKVGDALGLISQPNGTLVITPKIAEKSEVRKKKILAKEEKNKDHLLRELIGAYMMGYDIIEIASEIRTTPEIREVVRNFTQMVIGPQIIEETNDLVVTKDLLNPTDMPFISTIRRMHNIVEGMHQDVITALREGDKSLAEDVTSRDREVDRLYWLVSRQYNMLLRDIKLVEKMQTTREQSINYLLIARTIERIGDHAHKIAENAGILSGKKLDEKTIASIASLSNMALTILAKSTDAFFTRDMSMANKTIDSVKTLVKQCEEIDPKIAQQKGEIALHMGDIVESIKRIGLYSRDIAESTINYVIDEKFE